MVEIIIGVGIIVFSSLILAALTGIWWFARKMHGLFYEEVNGDPESTKQLLIEILAQLTEHHEYTVKAHEGED